MQTERRILANEVETINESLLKYKNLREPIKRPLLGTYYHEEKGWFMGLAEKAATELR